MLTNYINVSLMKYTDIEVEFDCSFLRYLFILIPSSKQIREKSQTDPVNHQKGTDIRWSPNMSTNK